MTITCRWATHTSPAAGIGIRSVNRAYANDLSHPASLQVTEASVNRSKGKQPPDEWRPEENAGWCRYASDWVSVKEQWELTVSRAEVEALKEMLDTCDDKGSWGLAGARPE